MFGCVILAASASLNLDQSSGVPYYQPLKMTSALEETEQSLLTDDGEYQLRLKSGTGDVRSVTIEGFSIPVRAIFDREANRQALATFVNL